MSKIVLPLGWYEYIVATGVSENSPGIYEWHINGIGSYIGKYKRIRRPTREYERNVTKILNNTPYRRGNPAGFRRIHCELANAHRNGRRITLTILENVDPSAINKRERELITERGSLNQPPFGR